MRRRISSRWVGNPILDASQILIIVFMGWFFWAIVGVDTPFAICGFMFYFVISALGLYVGFHMRRIELDQQRLYVGRFLRPGYRSIALAEIKSIKLRRPLPNQILVRFEEGSVVGPWVVLVPRLHFLSLLSNHPDVVELMNLVSQARRNKPAHDDPPFVASSNAADNDN